VAVFQEAQEARDEAKARDEDQARDAARRAVCASLWRRGGGVTDATQRLFRRVPVLALVRQRTTDDDTRREAWLYLRAFVAVAPAVDGDAAGDDEDADALAGGGCGLRPAAPAR
jgi:hypothetical protein